MLASVGEWLNLVLRWTHVIAGIAWIGSSFFFMWLDSHLEKPETPKKGVEGELWMTHSGGFYLVEKLQLAPAELPKTLHWFKWEAAFTWMSGFLLLCLVYYLGARVYMIDPAVADISPAEAVGIGLGLLVAGWLVYDGLYRSPLRHKGALVELIGIALLVALAYGLTHLYSGRGAYMQIGAMLGTIMVANVWVIIIPAQRALVEATKAGKPLDARYAFNAKQRSVHNNYMTLPVVFIMLSSHYPSTFGNAYPWAVLLVLFAIGAVVRHWFNLRNAGTPRLWPIPAATLAMLGLVWATLPRDTLGSTTQADSGEPVTFAQAYDVISKRCVACHARKPTNEAFDAPPKNIVFETAQQIHAQASKIKAVAVLTHTMPLGNLTRMTDDERRLLGRWISEGAEIE